MVFSCCVAFAIVLLTFVTVVFSLPAGFEEQDVLHIKGMVDIAFTPDDEFMFVVTKPGLLISFNLDTEEEDVALDLTDDVCDNGERGLTAVTFHPEYDNNRWVYLFYTYNQGDSDCRLDSRRGPINRCSRFIVNNDNTISRSSELILFQSLPLPDKIHNGGDMEFGVDGMLYVTTGDAGQRSKAWAQDLSNLHGTILRLTDDGGIPSDNPFRGSTSARCADTGGIPSGSSATTCQEIFAYGLRNPFRFTMDPHSQGTVRFLVSDVGGTKWEEINEGGADFAGANYGWPEREGPCEYNSYDDCDIPSRMVDPIFWYPHDDDDESGCVNAAAIPPLRGLNWPAPYDHPDSYFYLDFTYGEMYHVSPDQSNSCRDCDMPRPGYSQTKFHDWDRGVGMLYGPYKGNQKALYFTARANNPNIRRIVYEGGDNFSPVASFTVDPETAPVNRDIEFDASSTEDPNHSNSRLTFEWDFGDGSSTRTGMVQTHQFSAVGAYEVKLTVTDPDGSFSVERIPVSIGDTPTVQITQPEEGTEFAVGDVFVLVGEGTDSSGNSLRDSELSWEVKQHHNNHFHPFLSPTSGNHIEITEAPEPEDFFAATNSYLEVILTGTDSNGLSTSVSRNIMPKVVYLNFETNPAGLTLSLDEETIDTPRIVLSWENHALRVIAPNQGRHSFTNWKDGVADSQEDIIIVPPSTTNTPTYTANFVFQGTSSMDLVILGNNGKPSDAFPLGNCQGDCDRDSECQSGLKCFQRDSDDSLNVPGCNGMASEELDYCYDPDDDDFTVSLTTLARVGNEGDPSSAFPLGMCEGDCDEDSDCQEGLVCFQREDGDRKSIPGCTGEKKGTTDYCYEGAPNDDDSTVPQTTLARVGNEGDPSSAFPLGICEGDCDEDSDCQDGLVCFQRENGDRESIPGCKGDAKGTTDYCYEGAQTSSSNNSILDTKYVGNNGIPEDAFPLSRCQAECDRDSDCQSNLVCFQRDTSERIPGCGDTGLRGSDYCYDPADHDA